MLFPREYVGKLISFSDTMRKDTAQATWHSPGVLKLDFAADEGATVVADVSITDSTGTERRTVTLPFKKLTEKNTGIINAPVEILKQAGEEHTVRGHGNRREPQGLAAAVK